MIALRILKGNADLVPHHHAIVLPDSCVPCDACGAAIAKLEAERNAEIWQRGVCDLCAEALAEANPEWIEAMAAPVVRHE